MVTDSNPHTSTVAQSLTDLARIVKAAQTGEFIAQVAHAAELIVCALGSGNKVLTCGNGGSAADAAHLAEELVGRYKITRRALPAVCLCADGPALTCIANDFGFEYVFARQLEALGAPGDVLVAFTTSGKSENINRAIDLARKQGLVTVVITGTQGGRSSELATHHIAVPSTDSARVQELHTFVLHSICQACENAFGVSENSGTSEINA